MTRLEPGRRLELTKEVGLLLPSGSQQWRALLCTTTQPPCYPRDSWQFFPSSLLVITWGKRPLLLSIRCGILMLFNLLPLWVISGMQGDLQYWHWADVLQPTMWKGFSFIVPGITYKESCCKLQQRWSFCLLGMGCRLSCLLVLGMCQQDREYSDHPERSFLQGTSLGAQT